MSSPKVSVSITTFNHAPFVRQALDGVLGQKTPFDVEVLIGEDDSSDGTREIVREYETRYPTRIRAFYHAAASKLRIGGRLTGRNNLAHNLSRARGEYIALLDGDDFWTDETKLARQVEQLERDPSLMTSFHDVTVVDRNGEVIDAPTTIKTIKDRYSLEEMLSGDFEAQTCSVVFRRGAVVPLPGWFFEAPVGDLVIHVLNGQRGDFGYLHRSMGSYRMHEGGVWSQGRSHEEWSERSEAQARRSLGRFQMMVDLLDQVRCHCAPRYR